MRERSNVLIKTSNHVLIGMECQRGFNNQRVLNLLFSNLHLLPLLGVNNNSNFLPTHFLQFPLFSLSQRLHPRKCKVILDTLRQRL